MKKINLLIAAGLLASASMQAQVVASLGFEDGDPKERTSQWALNHQAGSFGDWVNKTDNDVWTEQVAGDVMEGEYAFQAVNGGDPGATLESWMRGFKFVLDDGIITENTPYRVTFWVKGPQGGKLVSGISQGTENYDKRICSPTGADYAAGGNDGITLKSEEWQFISYCVFFTKSDDLNSIIANQDWVGNAVFPEIWGGDGEKTYAQHFEGKLPNEFFFAAHMRSTGTYLLDDIKIEKGVTYNQVQFGATAVSSENVVKFDFGYPTNIAALAEASETGSLSLDPSCVTITVNGAPATVKFVEGKTDGFLYAFLDLGEEVYLEDGDEIVASFTPAAGCPIYYTSDRRPTADTTDKLTVFAIANAPAMFVVSDDLDVTSVEAGKGKLVSTTPENESFEIDAATFNQITLTYDKELDPDLEYASATLTWDNGTQEKDLTPNLSLSEDGKTLNIAIDWTLADGEYTLNVYDVETKFWASCPDVKLTFAVGPDNDQTVSEKVYGTDETFAATTIGSFPVGWVANDNGTVHQYGLNDNGTVWNYDWSSGIAPGGGGTRSMGNYSGDLVKAAIYWRNFNGNDELGTLTFGEQVKDYILQDGTIDPEMDPNIALYLDAKKHQITIRMCAWKNLNGNADEVSPANAPVYDFTLEDLKGNVYARFKDVKAMPNVNGATNRAVNNVTKSVTDFTVEKPGYYVLKFSSTQVDAELLLGGVDIITMPSKAAYWKQQLAAAAQDAKNMLDTAADAKYNGDTKTALTNAYTSATTGHFTSPSEIQALIDEMKAESTKLQTRMTNIDNFVNAVASITEVPEDLTGKYTEADLYKSAIGAIETYKDVDPSTLSDEELAAAAPKLTLATQQIGNVKSVVDALTWRAYKAWQTAGTLGVSDTEREAAINLADDNDEVVNDVNAASTQALYQILANENGVIADELKTTVNYTDQKVVEEGVYVEKSTSDIATSGIEFTSLVKNPKLYTYVTSNTKALADDDVVGWKVEQYEGGNVHTRDGDFLATEARPVVNTILNSYSNGSEYHFYQVIENVPVGVYDICIATRTALKNTQPDPEGGIGVFNAANEDGVWDKYIYAQVGDGERIMTPFAAGGSWTGHPTIVKNVTVQEGQTLTIGVVEHMVSGKASGHDYAASDYWVTNTFVGDARIFFVAPLEGYNYGDAATSIKSVEDAAKAAKKNGVKYNIAGQRVDDSYKGFVIINGKKYRQ